MDVNLTSEANESFNQSDSVTNLAVENTAALHPLAQSTHLGN